MKHIKGILLDELRLAKIKFHEVYRDPPKFLLCTNRSYRILKRATEDIINDGVRTRKLTNILDMTIIIVEESKLKHPSKGSFIYRLSSTPIMTAYTNYQDLVVSSTMRGMLL